MGTGSSCTKEQRKFCKKQEDPPLKKKGENQEFSLSGFVMILVYKTLTSSSCLCDSVVGNDVKTVKQHLDSTPTMPLWRLEMLYKIRR
ncbi:hypothetical protein L2E82_25539 [Cichorium intybus]|uniref:Uncharacterized protein n=1 Tax=Cichorium intybus TaxID=13427 RepID=A0ACB9E471_CICIN|nr:hypothetical protein L2E82_25539 [Cichorium intybus]